MAHDVKPHRHLSKLVALIHMQITQLQKRLNGVSEPTHLHPPINTYKNHLNSGFLGPSLNFSVLTSLALKFTPCLLFLLLLSSVMKIPNSSASNAPVAPNAAVVANAGTYFGAS